MWECPKCNRTLRNANQWHNCVIVSLDELFENKPKVLEFTFDKLLGEVIDWPDVSVSATKNCIVFLHRQTFLIVKPMTKWLEIKFYLPEALESPYFYKVEKYGKRNVHIVRIATLDEVTTDLVGFIKQSYNLL